MSRQYILAVFRSYKFGLCEQRIWELVVDNLQTTHTHSANHIWQVAIYAVRRPYLQLSEDGQDTWSKQVGVVYNKHEDIVLQVGGDICVYWIVSRMMYNIKCRKIWIITAVITTNLTQMISNDSFCQFKALKSSCYFTYQKNAGSKILHCPQSSYTCSVRFTERKRYLSISIYIYIYVYIYISV